MINALLADGKPWAKGSYPEIQSIKKPVPGWRYTSRSPTPAVTRPQTGSVAVPAESLWPCWGLPEPDRQSLCSGSCTLPAAQITGWRQRRWEQGIKQEGTNPFLMQGPWRKQFCSLRNSPWACLTSNRSENWETPGQPQHQAFGTSLGMGWGHAGGPGFVGPMAGQGCGN